MKIILNIVTNCPSMADAREYFDMAIKLQNIEIRFDAL
jgi:fumarate reductase subunit C